MKKRKKAREKVPLPFLFCIEIHLPMPKFNTANNFRTTTILLFFEEVAKSHFSLYVFLFLVMYDYIII